MAKKTNPAARVNIPIADHGLHSHNYRDTYLGTFNFLELMPVYYRPLDKGESDNFNLSMFSRLQPNKVPPFVTGSVKYRAFFVPYTLLFKPWYNFRLQIPYKDVKGNTSMFSSAPHCTYKDLNLCLIDENLRLSEEVSGTPSDNDFDFTHYVAQNNYKYFKFTDAGRRVMKVLNGVGIWPTFTPNDTRRLNVLALLAYFKIYLDWYFPGNYVGSQVYNNISTFIRSEDVVYDQPLLALMLQQIASVTSYTFYDKTVFDYAFDSPAGPSRGVPDVGLEIVDNTYFDNMNYNPDNSLPPVIYSGDPGYTYSPNGPHIGNNIDELNNDKFVGRITQFGIDALSKMANYMRRRHLAGSRLVDAFLANHGIQLGHIEGDMSYYIGEKVVPINVDAVENNSDTNLGQLAGKAISYTQSPVNFNCHADHDGIFMVFCSVEPDCDFPVSNDVYSTLSESLDFYNPQFDKLGVEAVPMTCVGTSTNGNFYSLRKNSIFGWLNRYYYLLQNRSRLAGDFVLRSRGSAELGAYHTFRLFNERSLYINGIYHSFNFLQGNDNEQYKRIFAEQDSDALMIYMVFSGVQKIHKLPLSDSYEWDEDEYNKKVSIVNQGLRV